MMAERESTQCRGSAKTGDAELQSLLAELDRPLDERLVEGGYNRLCAFLARPTKH